jgi:hypothetical protein
VFGGKKKNILANGIQARATITNISDTGMTINDNPRVKLTLRVQPEGEQAFEVTKKVTVSRVAIPQVGAAMWVRYDPANPSDVEFDDAKTDEVNAAATSAGAGFSVGGIDVSGAQVIDARGVPGVRDAIIQAVGQAGGAAADPAAVNQAVLSALGQAGVAVPGGTPASGGAAPAAEDPLDRLKKLNDLRQAGALTDAEFEAQKAKILAET